MATMRSSLETLITSALTSPPKKVSYRRIRAGSAHLCVAFACPPADQALVSLRVRARSPAKETEGGRGGGRKEWERINGGTWKERSTEILRLERCVLALELHREGQFTPAIQTSAQTGSLAKSASQAQNRIRPTTLLQALGCARQAVLSCGAWHAPLPSRSTSQASQADTPADTHSDTQSDRHGLG